MSAARRTKSGSCATVSFRPVSQSETRGVVASTRAGSAVNWRDVAHDAVEEVLAAHQSEGLGIGGIERDAQLVQAGLDQFAALPRVSSVPLVLNST